MTLEIIGVFFIKQLERSNLVTFRQQIGLPAYVSDQLTQQLTENSSAENNADVHATLSGINNVLISDIQVIDTKGVVRGTVDINKQDLVGQKTTDENLRDAALSKNYVKNKIEQVDHTRYQIVVKPLIDTSDGENKIVGAVEVKANLESVYDSLKQVALIYASATVVALFLGVIMAFIMSRTLTKPIMDISERTVRISSGDYSGVLSVRGHDEISQLAHNVNLLSRRIEETTSSQELERQRLDSVLEHMTDGVIATDRRGSINLINPAALRLLGINDESKILGKYVLKLLRLDDQYQLRNFFGNVDNLLLDFGDEEHELTLKVNSAQIQRESGFISGMVVVLHDVTEEQRINQERRQFVSNVSHELRTPLTSVKSYIDALQEGAIEGPELTNQFLEVVQSETGRMINMINDLLELSRMDRGVRNLELEWVNLGALFEYILNRFDMIIASKQAGQKDYRIIRKIDPTPVWVEVDPSKFTQVIDNIMNNAIKYSPDGGIILTRMELVDQKAVISIKDQGLGIPQKDVQHVFDRFFRVDKARSRAQGGTGLGLAIAKEIVESFGGRIWAESKEGQGSEFKIALPYSLEADLEDDWSDNEE